MTQWIKCSERMPKPKQVVDVWIPESEPRSGRHTDYRLLQRGEGLDQWQPEMGHEPHCFINAALARQEQRRKERE